MTTSRRIASDQPQEQFRPLEYGVSRTSSLRRERNTLSHQLSPKGLLMMQPACSHSSGVAGQYCSLQEVILTHHSPEFCARIAGSGRKRLTLSTTNVSSRRRCAAVRLPRAHRFAAVPTASCGLQRSLPSLGHPNHGFGPIVRIFV